MRFSKMHGLGNDFIFINGFKEKLPRDLADFSKKLCHRRLGIGADGLIALLPSEREDVIASFVYYNADGSQAEMCGNGMRCAALFARQEGITCEESFALETPAGLIRPEIISEPARLVRVDMGPPRLLPGEIPALFSGSRIVAAPLNLGEKTFFVTVLSMGNPHCVIFVDDVVNYPVVKIGPQIEQHHFFPAKTNVEFIELVNESKIKMRVWERGCGETLACGTGACAAAVAAILNGYTKNEVEVQLKCGSLFIEWHEGSAVQMLGPAVEVYRGEYVDF